MDGYMIAIVGIFAFNLLAGAGALILTMAGPKQMLEERAKRYSLIQIDANSLEQETARLERTA